VFHIGRCLVILLACALVPCGLAQEKKDDKPKDKNQKDEFKLSAEERSVIDLTNAERKKADKELVPLTMNPQLMEAARKHGENMAAQEKMEHELDGKKVPDRADDAGYKWVTVGENIASKQPTPKEVVAAWMKSPTHRDNILNGDYTEIGVAMVKSKKGVVYWVQVFGSR
jgi:uncharacterized protein YkwD